MTAKETSAILATWVGIIAAIVGGYVAYLEYEKSLERQVDERSLTAIRFVQDFQSEHFLELRSKFHDLIFCGSPGCVEVSNSEFFAFVEFFDVVKYCSDKSLCDPVIIGDVFGPYAMWHWPCLKPTIEGTRRTEEGIESARPFGHGLETLASRDVGDGHCSNL